MAFRKNIVTIEPPPAVHACSDSIYSVHCLIVLYCQHIPCADPFWAATLMLQTFQTMIKEFLGRGSILSDAVGVDGLTYLPSLPLLSLVDGLKPYLL